jgi:O-antigen/teichoic acid export membrane protein
VAAGVIVSTAIRIVVAPRFSALLSAERRDELRELYAVTSLWILVFGAPIYLGLAVFAPTVLGWLGPDFGDGVSSMVVLCLGSIVVLGAGNVQSLLLMSGRTSWVAANKLGVVLFNVAGNLVLVPMVGIIGAAATWAASMLLDTLLAVWQTHRATGLTLPPRPVARATALVGASVLGPSLVVVWLWGQGSAQLLLAAVLSAGTLLALSYADRERLHLHELRALGRSRSPVP